MKETKSSDIHDTICETTKFATSGGSVCNFEEQFIWFDTNMGSFSFKPNQTDPRTGPLKCYQPVKCRSTFAVMFISITDFKISNDDDSTYFSIAVIDSMEEPGETLKFDKNSVDLDGWIQVRDQRTTERRLSIRYSRLIPG